MFDSFIMFNIKMTMKRKNNIKSRIILGCKAEEENDGIKKMKMEKNGIH